MSLPRSLSCAVLALSLLLPLGAAHAAPVTYVFATVDRYVIDWHTSRIDVRGVLQGESAPSTVSLQFYYSPSGGNEPSDRCEKLALLSMSSPGRYQFELSVE
ncbi:MAG TPA: hypothetical protein VFO83_02435, partial [Aggregicoccus sp.]|nr:hypothetical protein [Aggregicoccus sp.]